jgi:hypothetical protein
MIFGGILLALLGLFGLGYCIWQGFRLRRSGGDLASITPALQRLIAINFAAVGLSAMGLMLIVLGFVF